MKSILYNKVKKTGRCLMLLPLFSLLLASCSDFLDKAPDDRVEIATEDQVIMLLSGSYPSSNYGWFCELSSDNIMDLNSEHYPIPESAAQSSRQAPQPKIAA